MKISTNSVGNYKPINNVANKKLNPIEKTKSEIKTEITKDEKNFFTKMYPDEKNTISNYQFYNKNGDKKSFQVGSLFDKRG
jgi:hypothetical protein